MQKLRTLVGLVALTLVLTACTTPTRTDTGDTIGGPRTESRVDRQTHSPAKRDPLLDAPHRTLITCTSEQPITVLQRFKEVRFACKSLGVSATINEMRDAGWRLLNLDIGEETEQNNHVGFPVTVTLRKLF